MNSYFDLLEVKKYYESIITAINLGLYTNMISSSIINAIIIVD